MEGNDTAYSPAEKELSRRAPALQEKTAPGTTTLGLRQQENLNLHQSAAADKPLRLTTLGPNNQQKCHQVIICHHREFVS
jgi:hypothetical protein